MEILECFFDGSCWPNPNGHAAGGGFVQRGDFTLYAASRYCGCEKTSNNVAEYQGLIIVLEYLVETQPEHAVIYGDSDMVIKQMSGRWKAKLPTPTNPRYYRPYFETAQKLKRQLTGKIEFKWIPREQNGKADLLSRQPLFDRGITSPY